MREKFEPAEWLGNFGISASDPGYVYILRSQDRLKIGRSVRGHDRLKQAKTWLPDAEILGVKPFWHHRAAEYCMQLSLTQFWYSGEWFDFAGDEFEEWFIAEFVAFDDVDINRNSMNFTYFMNSTGMSEYAAEFSRRIVSKISFHRSESVHHVPKLDVAD